jgi:hypothetical protein
MTCCWKEKQHIYIYTHTHIRSDAYKEKFLKNTNEIPAIALELGAEFGVLPSPALSIVILA